VVLSRTPAIAEREARAYIADKTRTRVTFEGNLTMSGFDTVRVRVPRLGC